MSEYKVIKILDEYSIIIDYGSSHMASIGDKLRIYVPGEEIKNPETDQVLGTLDKIKETVEVSTVYENFSVCNKITERVVNVINPLAALTQQTRKSIQKLNVDEENLNPFEVKSNEPIKVGDLVMKVRD